MRLTVKRLDERRYESIITRDDGVRYHLKGIGHMFAIPHDLAHLVVEQTLGLRDGFFGSIAEGAVFESMSYIDGRRKPGAAARSKAVLKANKDRINEVEGLVRIINDALEEGLGAESADLRKRVRERWTPPGKPARVYADSEITAVAFAWRQMLASWNALPVGETLSFDWSVRA